MFFSPSSISRESTKKELNSHQTAVPQNQIVKFKIFGAVDKIIVAPYVVMDQNL